MEWITYTWVCILKAEFLYSGQEAPGIHSCLERNHQQQMATNLDSLSSAWRQAVPKGCSKGTARLGSWANTNLAACSQGQCCCLENYWHEDTWSFMLTNTAWFLWHIRVSMCAWIQIHTYKEACGCIRVFYFSHFRWSICITWKQFISNASIPEEEGQLSPIGPEGAAGSAVAFYSFYCAFPAWPHL